MMLSDETDARFDDVSDWLSYWLEKPRLPKQDQATFNRYYHSFIAHFGPYVRDHYASQMREAQEIVIDRPGCRVLEIGCGCGTESLWMGLLGASVTGIDIQQDRLSVARAQLDHTVSELGLDPDVTFQAMSAFDARKLGNFDVIWVEQAFHHVEPREEFVQILAEVLRPRGIVVFSESNAWNPLIQLRLLRRRGFKTIKEYQDDDGGSHVYGDERITTPRALEKELKRVGIGVQAVRYYRIFPNRQWADRLSAIESVVPTWFRPAYTHYNLVAQRAE